MVENPPTSYSLSFRQTILPIHAPPNFHVTCTCCACPGVHRRADGFACTATPAWNL